MKIVLPGRLQKTNIEILVDEEQGKISILLEPENRRIEKPDDLYEMNYQPLKDHD